MAKPYYLYSLTFPNRKRYIGYTMRPRGRMQSHKSPGCNPTSLVRRAISKFGLPKMQVLCVGRRKYIATLEAKAIEAFKTYLPKYGYNGMIGGVHTQATRANIKAALAKSKAFVAVRQRIGGWNKGIPHSAEHRAKIGAYHRGKPKSAEQRAKMSAARKKAWAKGKYG